MNRALGYDTQQSMTEMIERHTSLVKRIAYHLSARLPANVLIEDLIQAGTLGLIEASRNFDAGKGASFETYAGIRIRGAMLDDVRKGDWVPRSVHRNSRMVAEALAALEAEYGREIKDYEVAEKLDIPLAEYHHILNDVNSSKIIGMDDLGVDEDALDIKGEGVNQDDLFNELQHQKFNASLIESIKNLPERESLVLSLYYNDEMNLREIGQILDVSESRVSQIHSQAMIKLRAKVNDWI